MEDKPKNKNVLIIVLVILGLLVSCVLGAIAGGVAGYALGRRAAMPRNQSYEWRHMPEEVTPAPRTPGVPRATPRVELPFMGQGALVTNLVPDGPAELAGVRRGDIIQAVDDQKLEADSDLRDILANYKPGETVDLAILRFGDELTISVELGNNPEAEGTPWLGIYYRMLADQD